MLKDLLYASKSDVEAELRKMARDPVYFINNYAKISNQGIKDFHLYEFQEDLVKKFDGQRLNIVLKGRQMGVSWTTAAYAAWFLLFRRQMVVYSVATKEKTAKQILKKVKFIYKNLPKWIFEVMGAKFERNSETHIKLSNGSELFASSTSGDVGRSESINLLILDEAALIDGLDVLWAGLRPTLSAVNGKCIAISTPWGASGWFYDTWEKQNSKENDFIGTKLEWYIHPERDQAWFEEETKDMSQDQIEQEFFCVFIGSGRTVIRNDDIAKHEKNVVPPEYILGMDDGVWVWEEVEPGEQYLMFSDAARGDGEDSNTFIIIRLLTMEIVAEYKGVAEIEVVDPLIAETMSNAQPGWNTHSNTRHNAIEKMKYYVENSLFKTKSSRMISEMRTFIWKNGKPQAERGKNDDLIIPLAFACLIIDRHYRDVAGKVEEKISDIQSIMVSRRQFSTAMPGMLGYQEQNDLNKDILDRYYQYGGIIKG